MYRDVVPNRGSPPAVLLREAWREGKRIRKRTLANLSHLPPEAIDALRRLLRGETLVPETASSTLGEVLGLEAVDVDECYVALDWLHAAEPRIEAKLAVRHRGEARLVLWDVTSAYFEGQCCPLAKRGHSRDGHSDRPQIVFGVLTTADGCPVAVEVYEGNTADPRTVAAQVEKLRVRFGLTRIVVVGDRGMLTAVRIRQDLKRAGLDWITTRWANTSD